VSDPTSACHFCGFDEPEVTVYADAVVQALISLAPINRYHVLVVPRRHYERLAEVPLDVLAAALRTAQRVSAAIAATARPDAITLWSDDDLTGAGFNLVPHWKLHLIPRYRGDRVVIDWRRDPDPGVAVRAQHGRELREALAKL
jgi:diadenosine tetraphosphate (Ap4A) HIT family hydrolase